MSGSFTYPTSSASGMSRTSAARAMISRLFEGRLADRKFEAVDLSDNKVFYYDQPQGFEYYDFVPEFTFVNTKTPCR
jgi:hypothetical protein